MVNGIVIIELTKTSLVLMTNYKARLKKLIICIIKKQHRTFKLTKRFQVQNPFESIKLI